MGTRASYTQERRLKQNTETLEATGTSIATAGQSSSAEITQARLQEVTTAYLPCFIKDRSLHASLVFCDNIKTC